MSLCVMKNHAMETYGGNAGTIPRIAQHHRPRHPFRRKIILHNSFKLLVYLIARYLFIIPFTVRLFANSLSPPPHGTTAPSGPGPPHCRGFTITLWYTTHCTTPPEEWSARRGNLYLTTHNTHERQTSMPPAGLKPAISASERLQTHAFARSATSIDVCCYMLINSSKVTIKNHVRLTPVS